MASAALLLFTAVCYTLQPDRFAAFTVMPIWLWGGMGLGLAGLAFYFMRARFSRVCLGLWALVLLIGCDEIRALGNIGTPEPLPGPAQPFESKKVIRVVTINTADFAFGDPTDDIAAWEPDIILLQQTNVLNMQRIASRIYGGKNEFLSSVFNGVITRWKIRRGDIISKKGHQQLTIERPDGRLIEIVNLHLPTAATDLRLWRRAAWQVHSGNRKIRRERLSFALETLDRTTDFKNMPTLLGGDFNAPAPDAIYRPLNRNFTDAFRKAGTGWGNTFHRRLPILRIDHLYTTQHLTAVRCKVVETRHSDHRFVVADFLLQ